MPSAPASRRRGTPSQPKLLGALVWNPISPLVLRAGCFCRQHWACGWRAQDKKLKNRRQKPITHPTLNAVRKEIQGTCKYHSEEATMCCCCQFLLGLLICHQSSFVNTSSPPSRATTELAFIPARAGERRQLQDTARHTLGMMLGKHGANNAVGITEPADTRWEPFPWCLLSPCLI